MDYWAFGAFEFSWLVQFAQTYRTPSGLCARALPNLAYSSALAKKQLEVRAALSDPSIEQELVFTDGAPSLDMQHFGSASECLFQAIHLWPEAVRPLLAKINPK